MFKNSRKVLAAALIAEHAAVFSCPICHTQMHVVANQSLVCAEGHCFDVSKHGYVNFTTHARRTKYDQAMFTARRVLFEHGMFDPLLATMAEQIKRIATGYTRHDVPLRLLDAGSGEGFQLSRIYELLGQTREGGMAVGIDIAKEAIDLAARAYPQAVWSVGDIANLPFADEQFDVIVNVLSPANYAEFSRVLRGNGIIVKVVPGSGYLQELRLLLRRPSSQGAHSHKQAWDLFQRHVPVLDAIPIQYRFPLEPTLVQPLVAMTPLSWDIPCDRIDAALAEGLDAITIDLVILIGQKR